MKNVRIKRNKWFEYSIHKVASTQNNSEQRPYPVSRTTENIKNVQNNEAKNSLYLDTKEDTK